ncbi:MAG: F0F1 ATP synthase subunit A [Deltaproteobacteria bacterium]|nr:F0F1 ATP synthase subunit A [Deltaproteobacteria bacterium]
MEETTEWIVAGVAISPQVTTTWGIMLFLLVLGGLAAFRAVSLPGRYQSMMEGVLLAIEDAVEGVLPGRGRELMPLVATLWLFIGVANMVGLVPGLHSPTAHLSVTAALSIVVFTAVHYFGIKTIGLRAYLHHYMTPSPILLPFHIISELTRTLALAMRLFGNIMSLEMAAMMILLVASFLAPVPLLLLHIVEALVQAYIFGVLAMIYIAGAIQAQQIKRPTNKE